jgi:hypothetical protein
MINHASAFILFLIVYFGSVAAVVLTEKSDFYTLWLLQVIFLTVAMLQLTVLLWHLGTKDVSSADKKFIQQLRD